MKVNIQKFKSPIGLLYLVADNKNVIGVIFEKKWLEFKRDYEEVEELETPILKKVKQQLSEYFAGNRKSFNLPYSLDGTVFQNKVWTALLKVPFGKTKSYKEQAFLVKSPKAVRAVGRTNGLNPLSIILPCHRIIGSNGSLTGYGGGLKAKKYLLELEGNKLSAAK